MRSVDALLLLQQRRVSHERVDFHAPKRSAIEPAPAGRPEGVASIQFEPSAGPLKSLLERMGGTERRREDYLFARRIEE